MPNTLPSMELKNILAEFARRYENFTSLLCGAAKYGCSVTREEEYSEIRVWMLLHYRKLVEAIRPYLASVFGPMAVGSEADPVEKTFRPPHLAQVLEADEGELITRVSLISEAVFCCCAGEHVCAS